MVTDRSGTGSGAGQDPFHFLFFAGKDFYVTGAHFFLVAVQCSLIVIRSEELSKRVAGRFSLMRTPLNQQDVDPIQSVF